MRRIGIAIGVVLAIIVLAFVFAPSSPEPPAPAPPIVRTVTIDGRDSTGMLVDPINVWASYEPRGKVVARVAHGTAVQLVRRDGDGVLIRTPDGTEGWVTYWFIKELK